MTLSHWDEVDSPEDKAPSGEDPPYSPVYLTVCDIVVTRRQVCIETPFCPNCKADLRQSDAVDLDQYEDSLQTTDLFMVDWGESEYSSFALERAWACTGCGFLLAAGTETQR